MFIQKCKDGGCSPGLAAAFRHHGEGGIDSTHWLLAIYTSCCCCHPLSVRDTAVSEVLSSALLSCMHVSHLLHTAQHHTVVGQPKQRSAFWGTKAVVYCLIVLEASWTWMDSCVEVKDKCAKNGYYLPPRIKNFMHKGKMHKNCKNKLLIYKKATEFCVPCAFITY